jgi:CRP-like cAMP-binding protein
MALGLVSSSSTVRNELLAVLPAEEIEHLRAQMQYVTLVMAQVLYEPGAPIEDVYFVQNGLVCLTADTGDNGFVEVGMTGRDGLVGATVLLDPEAVSAHRAVVQVPGHALRLRASALREAIEQSPVLRDRCLRYLQVLLIQASQSAACNARHEMLERLARWLIMMRDRVDTDELPMLQEYLAQMIGVRRAGVSMVTSALQATGVIRQGRGRIVVLDRAGLEAEACDCYRFIEGHRRRIMSFPQKAAMYAIIHS